MDRLLKILNELVPGVDFTKENDLVGEGILDSLSIVMLVADIEEEFGIKITPVDILPDNFCSADAIYALVTRLKTSE